MTAISAHQGGSEHAPEGTYDAYRSALEIGAEYVEFDIRRTADGTLVSCHPARAARQDVAAVSYDRLCRLVGHQVPRMTEVLPMLAGRAAAHLDLKQADCAEDLVRLAAGILGSRACWSPPGTARWRPCSGAVSRLCRSASPSAATWLRRPGSRRSGSARGGCPGSTRCWPQEAAGR